MDHTHHHHHSTDHVSDFKKRFWISLILTLPIMVLSPMIQMFFKYHFLLPQNHLIIFGLSTLVYFYAGKPFITGMFDEIKNKKPGMMLLIGLAISIAYFYSAATTFGLPGEDFYWELATLITIMLLGHWIEMKSILGASRSLELLVKMMPAQAHLIIGESIKEIKIEELQVGHIILIKPGEKVPADGIIIEGISYLNEAMLTGESKPVEKTVNDTVIGGSINGNGSLKVQVKHTGEDSYLAKVIQLVQEAQQSKSQTQRFADKAAKWLTFIAIAVGLSTFIIWLSTGHSVVFALERMVTVMVISCPHALGLAVPLVVAISTTIAAQNGLLIRDRTAFENSRNITTLIFDKTGTLTKGEFGVTRFESLIDTYPKELILSFAAALEQHSEHPIAVGIVNKSKQLNMTLPTVKDFQALTGKGVQGKINHQSIQIVSPGYLRENNITIKENIFTNAAETIVFILIDGALAGFIGLADQIRPESYEAIKLFKKNHIRVLMITGDNPIVAKAVSTELGLDGFYAETLPHQKLEIVKQLQNQNEFIAMTGDGVNDAPALAQANVGIAIGSGTDVAAETADIILVKSNPKDIVNLILFGKTTYNKMVQNLLWATGYNIIAIPLAAGILYHPFNILLGPALGAALMSLSTVIVAINAQLLKRKLQ